MEVSQILRAELDRTEVGGVCGRHATSTFFCSPV
jgi:hypothetical protein